MIISLQRILKNKKLLSSLLSQFLTLSVSILMTVGVTKFITIEEYGYWQLFIFYTSYVGLAHLGICDGLYLRYGGEKFENVPSNEIKGIYIVFLIIQLIFTSIILLYSIYFPIAEFQRREILIAICILLFISNSQIFLGYILLSTNRIIEYSKSIYIEKILLLIFIISGILLKKLSLEFLIISFIFAKIFSLIFLFSFYSSLFKVKSLFIKDKFLTTIKSGSLLMISNIVSTLIIGVGRYFIDHFWDIKVFGKTSLAISLVYFVLVLLSQISYVLFPYLRNNSEEDQKKIFTKLNILISIILKVCIVLYFPIMYFLEYLLPNYIESIHFILLLLPICLYDGKMQILYISYFKNLYLQKELLLINLASFMISLIFSFIGAYFFKSLNIILIGVVISVALRSILAEFILVKRYDLLKTRNFLLDFSFSLTLLGSYFFSQKIFLIIILLVLFIIINTRFYSKYRNYANTK